MIGRALIALVVALLVLAPDARAESTGQPPPSELRPQIQLDGGLSVAGFGYEHPFGTHVAVQVEAFIFGTYFLPWFDLGNRVAGFGVGIRPTWFLNAGGRGFYVTPYLRGATVDDTSLAGGDGLGLTAGAFAGWAFGLTDKLDLRLGLGAQFIHAHTDASGSFSTPFAAIDGLLGYRL